MMGCVPEHAWGSGGCRALTRASQGLGWTCGLAPGLLPTSALWLLAGCQQHREQTEDFPRVRRERTDYGPLAPPHTPLSALDPT